MIKRRGKGRATGGRTACEKRARTEREKEKEGQDQSGCQDGRLEHKITYLAHVFRAYLGRHLR